MRIKITWRKTEPTIIEKTSYQPHTSYLRLFNNDDPGHEFFIPWSCVETIETVRDKQPFYDEEAPQKDKQ
jgi:hypothetical protein